MLSFQESAIIYDKVKRHSMGSARYKVPKLCFVRPDLFVTSDLKTWKFFNCPNASNGVIGLKYILCQIKSSYFVEMVP